MTYLNLYLFDSRDWTNPGLFTGIRLNRARDDKPRSSGADNTLSIFREDPDNETRRNVLDTINGLKQTIDDLCGRVSGQFQAGINFFFRPPIRVSYVPGFSIVGPGGSAGGLPSVPDEVKKEILFVVHTNCHVNTPPGAHAADGVIRHYFLIHVVNDQAQIDLVGSDHPWKFVDFGVDAFQDEINLGQTDIAEGMTGALINGIESQIQLGPVPVRDLYLLPGNGDPLQQEGDQDRDDASLNTVIALIL